MTTNRTRFLVVSLVVSASLSAASWVAAQARRDNPEADSLYKYLSVFSEVLGLVRQAYVDETEVAVLMNGAYEGTADALGTFAVFVPADQVAEYRRVRGDGPRDTGLTMVRERGWIYVAGVADGSLAEQAGFERGDLVAKVDGEPSRDLRVWQIEGHLRRNAARPVTLTVLRRGVNQELTLPAEGAATARGPKVTVRRVDGVPVLRLPRFDEAAPAAVERELQALARAGDDQLVIDLRGAAGGDPRVAYQVADLLLAGELGTLRSRDTVRERFAASGAPVWQGKLVVLVDRGTLGAAEVLTAVLREGARATTVGEATFGHAGRQAEIALSSGALLELTDAFYTGPKGELIDESLEPEVEVTERSRRLGERELELDELILRRGLGVLAGEEQKKAA